MNNENSDTKLEELTTYLINYKMNKERHKQCKFAFLEKLTKEICLKELQNPSYIDFDKEKNKQTLKETKNNKQNLENIIKEKCKLLYEKNKKEKEDKEQQIKLDLEHQNLLDTFNKLEEEAKTLKEDFIERETIVFNLSKIFDKINEFEKLEIINEDDINLIEKIRECESIYKNYLDCLDENTGDLMQQEKHFRYIKGLGFLSHLFGYAIKSCEYVNDKARVQIESSLFEFSIYIKDFKLDSIKVNRYERNGRGVDEVIQHCIAKNNPSYLFVFLMLG